MNAASRHRIVPVTASLAAAVAATTVHAQNCTWTTHAPWSTVGSIHAILYHDALERVIMLRTSGIWAWDGSAWVLQGDPPPNRMFPAAAYDSARNRVVYFGGQAGSAFPGDTWEWDGSTWTSVPATAGPQGRWYHAMAFDAARSRTVLFGGGAGSTTFAETWEWDGQQWSIAATKGPAPRRSAVMAYDSVRMRTVLYGGRTTWGANVTDLWEWDGAAWQERPGAAPGENPLWMVFDPARARMIMGRSPDPWAYPAQYETWEFDTFAGVWHLRHPGEAAFLAAFDIARDRAVGIGPGATMEYNGAGTLLSPYFVEHPFIESFGVGAAVVISVEAAGAEPLSYQWRYNGVALSDGGKISGATTATLNIDPWEWRDSGNYDVVVSNTCASVTSASVLVPGGCYPNCDRSYVPPLLNVDDFTCFIYEFAAGQALPHAQQITHYANCDQSTVAPVLNVDDFTCFINAFAVGCP